MAPRAFHAAIDLGAGSGRVFVGEARPDTVRLHAAHRFHYGPRQLDGHLRWDMAALLDGLRSGLRSAAYAARSAGGELISAGVDSWGVDYGLLDADGRLLEDPICYRDARTARIADAVFARVSREAIFDATGIQILPFNTLFQLAAHVRDGLPARTTQLLLIPDLCHHALCGSRTTESTNASTTQLLNVRTGAWDEALVTCAGIPRAIMPALVSAGCDLGPLRPEIAAEIDAPAVRIVAPATHDTASAVIGTPLAAGWAYLSSGTWSLVGVERETPLLDADVMRANVTNERGVGGTFRFLKNVAGLWLLESCRREWIAAGLDADLPTLLATLDASSPVRGLIDPDAPELLHPPSMVRALSRTLADTRQPTADDPVAMTKVLLDSLALRYASVVRTLESLTRQSIAGIHITGGGALNDYLNQATANATGRLVLAGPVEATAIGNLLVQAQACGLVSSVADGRHAVAAAFTPRRFEPRDSARWRDATERYGEIEERSKNYDLKSTI